MKAIDHTGKTYNRLTGIKYVHTNKDRHRVWLWECICGKILEIPAERVKKGENKSCGCLRKELASRSRPALVKHYGNAAWKALGDEDREYNLVLGTYE